MTIVRRLGVLTAAAAGFLAAIPFATGAAAGAAEKTCWTTEPEELTNEGLWTYSYEVSWCAEGHDIVSIKPTVTPKALDPACIWVGSRQEPPTPTEDGTGREVFNVGEFSCSGDVGAKGVNPWVILNLYPNGTCEVSDSDIYPRSRKPAEDGECLSEVVTGLAVHGERPASVVLGGTAVAVG
jgi:hypothetical protein